MLRLIMGLKGSGKTKRLVDFVSRAVEEENGDIVVIEKEKKLIYDIPYRARLINASEYDFCSSVEFFKGFISGLYAGNYDITHVFIDNFFKILKDLTDAQTEELLEWLDKFGEGRDLSFTISATADPEKASERVKKYFI